MQAHPLFEPLMNAHLFENTVHHSISKNSFASLTTSESTGSWMEDDKAMSKYVKVLAKFHALPPSDIALENPHFNR